MPAITNSSEGFNFPVGYIVITETNTNPSEELGGTWELHNKGFREQELSQTFTSDNGSITTASLYKDGTICMRLAITNNVVITDAKILLATVGTTSHGVTKYSYDNYFIAASDGGNGAWMGRFESTLGEVSSEETLNFTLSAGNTSYITLVHTIAYNDMLDDFCNKFYWKRTS